MKKVITLVLAAILLGSFSLQASQYKAGESVTISERQDKNVYVAGGNITVNAIVDGDLIVAGGTITVNDSINDAAIITGGEIEVMGVAGNDLRVFGGEIRITKDVHGDLVITGGEVQIDETVTIWGDLVVAGGEVASHANVKGDVKMAGGDLILRGRIDGKLDVAANELSLSPVVKGKSSISAQSFQVDQGAQFFGDVRYWSKRGETDFQAYLMDGAEATYDTSLKKEFNFEFNMKKAIWSFTVFRILSGIVLISLLVLIFGRFFVKNAGGVRLRMGNYLGSGLLLFFGLPLASIIAFGTVIGIPLGVVGMSLFVILLVLANALTAVVAAYEIREYRRENWNTGAMIAISIALFIALRMLDLIPVAGSLVNFALSAIAVGYVIKMVRKKRSGTDDDNTAEEIV